MKIDSLLVRLALVASLVIVAQGCGGSDSKSSASPPPPPAAAAPTPQPAPPPAPPPGFSAAKLPLALMAADRVTTLVGAGFQTQRDKTTDPQLPFSSVATMGATLMAQNVSLLYNSFQSGAAPAAGRPFAVQNTVQGYPSAANAMAAFTALKTAWQGNLFQNVTQQGAAGGTWQESFCQIGNFTTTGGQAQQWYVCMARSGAYIVTTSIGGFPGLNINSISDVVRAYFADVQRAVE